MSDACKPMSAGSSNNKVLRFFLSLLGSGGYLSQQELGQKLDCSLQTVARMADEIESVVGFDSFKRDRIDGRNCYQLRPLRQMRNIRQPINSEELRYLNLCVEIAGPYLPPEVRESVENTLFQFMLMASDRNNPFLKENCPKIMGFYQKGFIDYRPHYQKLRQISDAAGHLGVLKLAYQAAGRTDPKEHLFAPRQILTMSGTIYVFGGILNEDLSLRHEVHLALHRILSVDETLWKFESKIKVNEDGNFGLPWHEPRTYQIRFAPGAPSDYVRERIFSSNQILEDREDGGVNLTLCTGATPELLSFVRSFGKAAKLYTAHGTPIENLDDLNVIDDFCKEGEPKQDQDERPQASKADGDAQTAAQSDAKPEARPSHLKRASFDERMQDKKHSTCQGRSDKACTAAGSDLSGSNLSSDPLSHQAGDEDIYSQDLKFSPQKQAEDPMGDGSDLLAVKTSTPHKFDSPSECNGDAMQDRPKSSDPASPSLKGAKKRRQPKWVRKLQRPDDFKLSALIGAKRRRRTRGE